MNKNRFDRKQCMQMWDEPLKNGDKHACLCNEFRRANCNVSDSML